MHEALFDLLLTTLRVGVLEYKSWLVKRFIRKVFHTFFRNDHFYFPVGLSLSDLKSIGKHVGGDFMCLQIGVASLVAAPCGDR